MTLRLRTHEYGLVLFLSVAMVVRTVWLATELSPEAIEAAYAAPFRSHGLAFSFGRNVLFPQIGQILLVCFAYAAVQVMVSVVTRYAEEKRLVSIGWIGMGVPMIAFLVALSANGLTWLARPAFFNYGGAGFHLLALFGFNEAPLDHLFAGFDHALLLIVLLTAAGLIREGVCRRVERPSPDRSQHIVIANDVSLSVTLCIALAVLVSAVQGLVDHESEWLWQHVFSTLPSALVTVLVTTYGLFRRSPSVNWRLAAKSLLAAVLAAACFALLLRHHVAIPSAFATNLGVNVCAGLPISAYLYRLRREKFVVLRSMQEKLSAASMQLQALRAQIEPHFLFNMLNTLYAHALRERATLTADGIQKLGDMMRSILDQHGSDAIPLSDEIDFLKNYIALNTLRMPETAQVESEIEEDRFAHLIAPMVFMVFVENAFKHGISASRRSFIAITLRPAVEGVRLVVRNSIHSTDVEGERRQIGLQNVIERLKLTYPDRHRLEHGRKGDSYVVDLTINLPRHA